MNKKILLMGSTGFTAKLLIPLLKEGYPDYESYSRSVDGDLSEFLTTEKFLKADLIINCIGPFNLTGKQIAKAVIDNAKKYIDITGELHFVKESFDELSAVAKTKGATLIHSCAFESFFADHLVNLITEPNEEIENLRTYYKFDSTRPSPGTRASAKLHSYFSRSEVIDNEWCAHNEAEEMKEVTFQKGSVSFFAPYPEILFYKKRFKAKHISSNYLIEESEAGMLSALTGNTKTPIEKVVAKLDKSKYSGPSDEERLKQNFELYVSKRNGTTEKVVKLSGKDMYLLTAKAVYGTLAPLLDSELKGIFSPYELIGDMSVFQKLCTESELLVEEL